MTQQYRFAGVVVASEIPLPLHPVEGAAAPAVDIRWSAGPGQVERLWSAAREVMPLEPGAGPGAMVGRLAGSDYLLRVRDVLDLRYAADARCLWVDPPAEEGAIDGSTIEHVLMDQALPRVLAHQGHLMVHASSVALGDRALCFVGPSGSGKSTMAALCHGLGMQVLADDAVRLELGPDGPRVFPAYPSLRLWGDSATLLPDALQQTGAPMAQYSPKGVYRLGGAPEEPRDARVAALVLLAPWQSEDVELARASPAAAVVRVLAQTFSLHPGLPRLEADKLAKTSAFCASLHTCEFRFGIPARPGPAHAAALEALLR